MGVTRVMKQLSAGTAEQAGLSEDESHALAAAMLDGGMGELELGAALALLERRSPTLAELSGFFAAAAERSFRVKAPAAPARPVVFASYNAARNEPSYLPLVAFMLQRLGVPVMVHGSLNSGNGVAAVYVFREMGIMPCATLAQAQRELDARGLAYVPTMVLAPGLGELLALKGRLGFGEFMPALARLIAPIDGDALQMAAPDAVCSRALLRDFFRSRQAQALLLDGPEGEAVADARRRPQIEHVTAGGAHTLFAAESGRLGRATSPSGAADTQTVAVWTKQALAGEVPVPMPLVNQIACCLYGAGYAEDLNQAKAIVALEMSSTAA